MGARPSSFKKRGGFLNNVDGVITDYEFTDDMITKDGRQPFTPGKKKGPDGKVKDIFHSLNCVLSVTVDGADEPVTTTLFVGGADDFEIEDEGKTLVPVEDGRELGAGTAFAKLITSLVDAGFPETNLPEDRINYESIIGTRCRFVQRVNAEDTKKLGKRKSKDGKLFDRTDLVVDQVYEIGEGEAPAPTKSAGKPAGKPAPKAAKEPSIDDLAQTALVEILQANKGSIAKSKLSMKTLTTPSLKGNAHRDDVRTWLFDDNNLKALQKAGVITYNKATGSIALAEEAEESDE